ncbi:transcription initiation protein [Ancylobacter sonchi]|uniref:transcription initiation protein n=1 Tax=Ancylobacter sonchi TaxID=1937790 RepID=UPI001BD36282|nr:transcription initiation protein [Ancylobacter sonchi]MBS7532898.1 transcription initiation protein [Ancylobacter sonchi]
MPKFLTIGYGDRAGYERLAPALREVAHSHDEKLRHDGALMGIAGPPVQLRNPDATGLETSDGAFMSAPLPVAGFAVIEAADMAQAVRLLSLTPCAVAHGVVEIWPLQEAV